jgi:hypothetical protein
MAKYYGEIGYLITGEKYENGYGTGIWEERFETRKYYGDQINTSSRWQASSHLNDDIKLTAQLSIVADPFAMENFMHIKYAVWKGAKWKVEKADPQYPRIILSLGGLYNGPEDDTSD